MDELTAFQRDALTVIAGNEAPKGVTVLEQLEAYYGSEIHHGRLYPNLNELASKGLIEKGKKDDRTNEYRLTDRGEQALEARRKWEDDVVDL